MLNRVREEVCDNHAIVVVNRASYCEALLLLAVGRPGASPRRHLDVDVATGRSKIESGESWTSDARR